MNHLTLNTGAQMPQLGYGVFQVPMSVCEQCVSSALNVGYRLIDTAQNYGNEEGVGAAIHKSSVPRSEIFLVSKIWISDYGYERAKASIDESLRKLQTDYLDLMLLHQPYCDRFGAYRALEDAQREGKLRAIGVSNFYGDHFVDLVNNVDILPAVNQMEMHVFTQQKELMNLMPEWGTKMMAWGPLAQAKNDVFNHPLLNSIGVAHGKTAAQVALRFLIQRGAIVIPKTTNIDRMRENINVFDFELTADEMATLDTLDTGRTIGLDHHDTEVVKLFMTWK